MAGVKRTFTQAQIEAELRPRVRAPAPSEFRWRMRGVMVQLALHYGVGVFPTRRSITRAASADIAARLRYWRAKALRVEHKQEALL